MILTRKITRTYDIYQEVEVNEELLEKFEASGLELDLENLTHAYDESAFENVWTDLEDLHQYSGDVIIEDKSNSSFFAQDDVCEYGIEEKSSIYPEDRVWL